MLAFALGRGDQLGLAAGAGGQHEVVDGVAAEHVLPALHCHLVDVRLDVGIGNDRHAGAIVFGSANLGKTVLTAVLGFLIVVQDAPK